MRVAPLGAFFADKSLEVVCNQARLSAEVTHAHAEGSGRSGSARLAETRSK
jgi:ADP-ribosylglycohydrolase